MNTTIEDEILEITNAIRPFFTRQMWRLFCNVDLSGPELLDYFRAEWQSIATEFEIEATS